MDADLSSSVLLKVLRSLSQTSKSKKSDPSASELFTIKRFETFAEIQAEIEVTSVLLLRADLPASNS